MGDYRFTCFEETEINFSDVIKNKQLLGKIMDDSVRDTKNIGEHYSKLSPKSGLYYTKFQEIYHGKCGYCGVNVQINNAALYEVDHYINKINEKNPTMFSLNNISNLVFSCKNCNQSKKEFDVVQEYALLTPDGEKISEIFYRGPHFEILINETYNNNEFVKSFYSKMKFDFKFRKLDYLLLNLFNLKDQDGEKKRVAESLFLKLLLLRNEVPSLKKLE